MMDSSKLLITLGLTAMAGAANAFSATPVPEPGILPLLGIAGIIAVAFVIRNRRK